MSISFDRCAARASGARSACSSRAAVLSASPSSAVIRAVESLARAGPAVALARQAAQPLVAPGPLARLRVPIRPRPRRRTARRIRRRSRLGQLGLQPLQRLGRRIGRQRLGQGRLRRLMLDRQPRQGLVQRRRPRLAPGLVVGQALHRVARRRHRLVRREGQQARPPSPPPRTPGRPPSRPSARLARFPAPACPHRSRLPARPVASRWASRTAAGLGASARLTNPSQR